MNIFSSIRFKGQLRPSQAEVVEIARRKLNEGQRKLHVVASPGSGKTVSGLYLWTQCVRLPALVLSPNSAIQAQWADQLDLFDCLAEGREGRFSGSLPRLGLIRAAYTGRIGLRGQRR